MTVLVFDPLKADCPVFLPEHFRQLGRVGFEDLAVTFSFQKESDIAGRCPLNLFDEPPNQVPFCHNMKTWGGGLGRKPQHMVS